MSLSTRYQIIERIIRNVYGGQPTDDSNITTGLVNKWIEDGVATAVKLNYKDSIQLDGVGYVNNSFYTTYAGLVFTQTEPFTFVTTLPQIPVGIGVNEGIQTLRFTKTGGYPSLDAVPMSENQWTYYRELPQIPNKVLYKPEGSFLYVISTLQLNIGYTASVTMISSGDDTNLNSTLNVPNDYIPIIIDYCTKMLMQQRQSPKDESNDGEDNV